MIDGSGVGDVGNIVLRDREVLSDDGIFIAVVTIDRRRKRLLRNLRLLAVALFISRLTVN